MLHDDRREEMTYTIEYQQLQLSLDWFRFLNGKMYHYCKYSMQACTSESVYNQISVLVEET